MFFGPVNDCPHIGEQLSFGFYSIKKRPWPKLELNWSLRGGLSKIQDKNRTQQNDRSRRSTNGQININRKKMCAKWDGARIVLEFRGYVNLIARVSGRICNSLADQGGTRCRGWCFIIIRG